MSSIRDDLNAAIETVETEIDEEVVVETEEEPEAESVAAEAPQEDLAPSEAPLPASVATPPDEPPEPEAPNDSLKAPMGWTPNERESWSKVPRHLQERILAREREMATAVANTSEARKLHEHFKQMAQAYAPVLAAEGVKEPMQAVESLFQTVASLRMGSPAQKAAEVARIVQQYGVDIQALDSALVGQTPQGGSNTELEALLEQKLAPVNQFMQTIDQLQQQQLQTGQQQAQDQITEFAKNAEFLNDVREDMADIIDLAAKRGVTLSLEDAYKRACAAHPEIAAVQAQREQDKRIKGDQDSLAAKQAAASSISGKQIGTGGGQREMTLREQIASAWDDTLNG